MSKSLGNYVGITDKSNDMFGKLMSIPDSAISNYLELVTSFSESDVTRMLDEMEAGKNPKDIKEHMAFDVVSTIHGTQHAIAARTDFDRVFRSREIPAEMPEIVLELPQPLISILRAANFATSNSEARRLIQQGGVRIDGVQVNDVNAEILRDQVFVLQAGRRRYVRIQPTST